MLSTRPTQNAPAEPSLFQPQAQVVPRSPLSPSQTPLPSLSSWTQGKSSENWAVFSFKCYHSAAGFPLLSENPLSPFSSISLLYVLTGHKCGRYEVKNGKVFKWTLSIEPSRLLMVPGFKYGSSACPNSPWSVCCCKACKPSASSFSKATGPGSDLVG